MCTANSTTTFRLAKRYPRFPGVVPEWRFALTGLPNCPMLPAVEKRSLAMSARCRARSIRLGC